MWENPKWHLFRKDHKMRRVPEDAVRKIRKACMWEARSVEETEGYLFTVQTPEGDWILLVPRKFGWRMYQGLNGVTTLSELCRMKRKQTKARRLNRFSGFWGIMGWLTAALVLNTVITILLMFNMRDGILGAGVLMTVVVSGPLQPVRAWFYYALTVRDPTDFEGDTSWLVRDRAAWESILRWSPKLRKLVPQNLNCTHSFREPKDVSAKTLTPVYDYPGSGGILLEDQVLEAGRLGFSQYKATVHRAVAHRG